MHSWVGLKTPILYPKKKDPSETLRTIKKTEQKDL